MSSMHRVERLLEDPEALDSACGPAAPLGETQARALLEGAMGRARAAGLVAPDERPTTAARSRRKKFPMPLMAVGALVVGSAAAGVELVNRLAAPASDRTQATAPVLPVADQAQRGAWQPAPSASASDVAQEAPLAEVPLEAPRAARTPAASAPGSRALSERSAPQTDVVHEANATQSQAVEPPVGPPPTPAMVEDLLASASELRRQGRYREALEAYLRITREQPGTRQAQVASIAAAAIRLDHLEDADGARKLYEAAVGAPGGLTEEAHHGVAETHRRTGNAAAELAALRSFVARYPKSPFTRSALQRIAELDRSSRASANRQK